MLLIPASPSLELEGTPCILYLSFHADCCMLVGTATPCARVRMHCCKCLNSNLRTNEKRVTMACTTRMIISIDNLVEVVAFT